MSDHIPCPLAAGGAEGPWDHASRLEQLQGSYPMQVVGIADPDVNKVSQWRQALTSTVKQ